MALLWKIGGILCEFAQKSGQNHWTEASTFAQCALGMANNPYNNLFWLIRWIWCFVESFCTHMSYLPPIQEELNSGHNHLFLICHVKNTPTMQFFNGISRNTQSKSNMLSLAEHVWEFWINALWDTHHHALFGTIETIASTAEYSLCQAKWFT